MINEHKNIPYAANQEEKRGPSSLILLQQAEKMLAEATTISSAQVVTGLSGFRN